jgi:hypothetical protein
MENKRTRTKLAATALVIGMIGTQGKAGLAIEHPRTGHSMRKERITQIRSKS